MTTKSLFKLTVLAKFQSGDFCNSGMPPTAWMIMARKMQSFMKSAYTKKTFALSFIAVHIRLATVILHEGEK